MKDMRISKLWMIWEYQIMDDMRISNYEIYENAKLWMIWEYQIMNDMRISNYEIYENVKIMKYMRM